MWFELSYTYTTHTQYVHGFILNKFQQIFSVHQTITEYNQVGSLHGNLSNIIHRPLCYLAGNLCFELEILPMANSHINNKIPLKEKVTFPFFIQIVNARIFPTLNSIYSSILFPRNNKLFGTPHHPLQFRNHISSNKNLSISRTNQKGCKNDPLK